MKKFATILTTALSALILTNACSEPASDVKVSGVELDRETFTLTVGGEGEVLTATVSPVGASNKAVVWSSADETIATVDAGGKVTAVSGGETEIIVRTKDGGKEDSCTVTVDDKTEISDLINLLDQKYIPDAAFLEYCARMTRDAGTAWDANEDGALSPEEAAAVKTMTIADIGAVRSIRGIEHFTGLGTLECRGLNNNLTVLDLTKNAALRRLICTGDALTSLNVSGCAALESLDVSGCPALRMLNCFSNNLIALDVSKCVVLTDLDCCGNRLTVLNVSQNTRLRTLFCYNNRLTALDVLQNTALESLDVSQNTALKSLDVSNNPSLTLLNCSNIGLTTLDVSNCEALKSLTCFDNDLTDLDVSNCTLLSSLNCSDNSLMSLDVSNNPLLTLLQCSDNDLAMLDVSDCVALKSLVCAGNGLTTLDVSNCAALTDLDCYGNSLTSLDLTGNGKLEVFSCGDNHLSTLTVGAEEYGDLQSFECQNNGLSAAALDDIFRALPDTGPEGPTHRINVSVNPGAATCDTDIATAKNWTVTKNLTRKR